MKLCSETSPLQSLEDMRYIIAFLREALCAPREVDFSNSGLAGAQLIFLALDDDVMEIRERIANSE